MSWRSGLGVASSGAASHALPTFRACLFTSITVHETTFSTIAKAAEYCTMST